MSNPNPSDQTKEQQHIDPVFKQVLTSLSKKLNVSLQTQVEISRLPRTIDALMKLPAKEDVARVESETPFIRLTSDNQIEFKALNDPLTPAAYHLIRGRTHLYLGENDLSTSKLSVTIVCARKPLTVLSHRPDHVLFKPLEKGYYISSTKPPTIIIVINELPIIPKNYPFLLFASSEKKFRQYLQHLVQEKIGSYLSLAYRVRPQITQEELKMLIKDPYLSDDDFQFIVQDIGHELLPYFPVEQRLAGLTPQERLAGLAPQERLAGLAPQERLAGLSADDIEVYLKQLKLNSSIN